MGGMVGPEDTEYVARVLKAGLIHSPCLEVGVGYGSSNHGELVSSAGIRFAGADLVLGEGVDYVVDFEGPAELIAKQLKEVIPLGSVLILNVLEHTFDPLRVLDNIFLLLRPGGTCVVLTPTTWPLHNCPYDTWRINPNLYEEYAKRRNVELIDEFFEYIGCGRVKEHVTSSGEYVLPKPYRNEIWGFVGRAIHKVFNTHGRGMMYRSHVATAAVLRKPRV
jgi:SAM-dependent methyltransferase